MARKLRIEYPGALHHVINRGNYRRDLFESDGACDAFLGALFEAADKFSWRVHAYVLMKNHFHMAIETPAPTLGEGMHWLQSTLAVRFNRFRGESGHLFQGRYKALLIENAAALAQVVDYIHLNPVRAKIVQPDQLGEYRWSSAAVLRSSERPNALRAADWLRVRGGWSDDPQGVDAYLEYLQVTARDESAWERQGLVGLGSGWAIGTKGWRISLAKEYAQKALTSGLPREQLRDLRQARWTASLDAQLARAGKTLADLAQRPRRQSWKIELARQVRNESGASIAWLASQLGLGNPGTLRGYLHVSQQPLTQQKSAKPRAAARPPVAAEVAEEGMAEHLL